MKKTLLFAALVACSASSFALVSEEQRAADEKENMKMLAAMGLPLPGSGINIVPRSQLGLTPEQIAQGDKETAEARDNGYVDKYINRPRELLGLTREVLSKEFAKQSVKPSPRSTGLSQNVNQLTLGFKFPSVSTNSKLKSAVPDIQVIAATPQGGFHEDKGGWSGAAQFFTVNGIGTCAYGIMNVKVSNTAAQLAQEDVTYTINNKATIILPVEGSNNSGFLYAVKWYDLENFHELECANMKYSADIAVKVINLAQNLDK